MLFFSVHCTKNTSWSSGIRPGVYFRKLCVCVCVCVGGGGGVAVCHLGGGGGGGGGGVGIGMGGGGGGGGGAKHFQAPPKDTNKPCQAH